MWPFTKSTDPTAGFSNDDVSMAALRLLRGRYPRVSHSWNGGTIERCDRAQVTVNALRTEFADFEPPRLRRAIMHWMDHFDYEISEARKDITTQKSKRDQDEYRAKNAAESDRVSSLLKRL